MAKKAEEEAEEEAAEKAAEAAAEPKTTAGLAEKVITHHIQDKMPEA